MKASEQKTEEIIEVAAESDDASNGDGLEQSTPDEDATALTGPSTLNAAELAAVVEALIFVADEPLTVKTVTEVLKVSQEEVQSAVTQLAEEFNARNGGLHLREIAGGWQFATRPEHHEYVRAFLKSRPSAKLSLASLETLAVIAYKQPITVPEILEIRGVQSPSAIKTLLDKRLIVAKGRKETIGRPMMYGTSKEFLIQFGLKDLSELPSIEDFEDLAGGAS
jgi:segregation and condensation protein B